MNRRYSGPLPSANFSQYANEVVEPTLMALISGEITASAAGRLIGAAKGAGRVVDVFLSVKGSGKDDSNTLSMSADVMINGTSCLTTAPVIAHVSGEAATNKTTKETGDTGITQAVIDADNDDYAAGDIFTVDWTMVRTASPTTEMQNAVVIVELEPYR